MFQKASCVIYPLHGAGYIERIEGEGEGEYLEVHIPTGNVHIRVARKKAEEMGVRMPYSKQGMEECMHQVGEKKIVVQKNWTIRQKENFIKLRTGRVEEVAEVVRILWELDQKKRLSVIENRMFVMAKQILLSEMVVVYEINLKNAELLLAKWLNH